MRKILLIKVITAILLVCTVPGIEADAQISQTNATGSFSTQPSSTFTGAGEWIFFYTGGLSQCSLVTGTWIIGRAGNQNPVTPATWSTVTQAYLGNTLGGAITVSFNCYHTGGNDATLDLFYGPTTNGPWTTIPDILSNVGSCANVTVPSFSAPEPGPLYVRFRFRPTYTYATSNSSLELGNISVVEAPLPACSGLPTAGTTISSLPAGCGNAAIPLRVSPSPNVAGISYQWQKSANNSTWVDITGATTKYTSVTQTAATYYRRKSTCSNSGQTAYSTAVLVTQANPALPCYCISGSTTGLGSQITNLTLGTVNNSSTSTISNDSVAISGSQGIATGNTSRYLDWTGSTVPIPNLPRGLPQAFSVSLAAYNPMTAFLKIYIDYNQDGDLLDPNELVYSGTPNLLPTGTATGTITVPAAALLGNTLMRIVSNDTASSLSTVTPCNTFERGETHDYRVNIMGGPACFGTPDVAVVAGPADACPNQAFALTASNLDPYGFPGLSYQWQSSAAGANIWTDLQGDTVRTGVSFPTGKTLAKDYRLKVTCATSGLSSYSNVFPVGLGVGTCFCTAAITNASGCQRWISSVATTGAVTNMTNPSACTAGGFADYTISVTGPTQYRDYPLNLNLTSANSSTAWSIYVDYDNDGAFASNELMYQNSNTTGGTTIAASFVIPLTAPLGVHRMRIRADSGATAATACTATVSGETEDYMLTVVEKPVCTGTPVPATLITTQPYIYCGPFPDKPMTLTGGTPTGTGGFTGIITTWEKSYDSAFSVIIPAYSIIGQNQSAYYRAKQTCATSGQSAYSSTILVANHAPTAINISPASPAVCAGSGGTVLSASVNVGPGGPALSYAWTANSYSACNNCISCTNCNSTTVNPAASTTFNVSISGGGCPGTLLVSRNVTVNPTPTVLSAIAPAAACSGQAITLTGGADTPGIYSGFAGPFAPSKWNFSQTTSNGKIITSGAPNTVVFISSDSTALAPDGGSDDWTINIPNAGNITFNWAYSTNDSAGNDFVRYIVNGGTPTNLPGFSNSGSKTQSGTATIAVPANSSFTLRGRSRTNTGGSSTTTISNFSAPGGLASTVAWYAAPTGGSPLANPVTTGAPGTYTYYAQAVTAAGCGSGSRIPSNPMTVHGAGWWTGAADSNWNTAGNWCGGIPTITSNLVIPGATTVPNMPVLNAVGSVNNLELQTGASLKVSGTGTLNLYGSLTGNGTFNADAATVNLAGTFPQSVPVMAAVGTLSVNGGSVKTLSGNIRVNTALNFTNGMVDVGSNTLTLAPAATVTGASAASYIRTSAAGGRLRQGVSSTPVVFPVGNTTYNPVILTNSGTADMFAVGVRNEVLLNGTTGIQVDPLNAQVVNRTWDVEEQTPGGSNVTMKLQWNAGETNTPLFDYNHVQVAHYTGGSYKLDSAYANPSLAPAALGYPGAGPYTATRSGILSFSPFTVTSSSISSTMLPVTLLAFRALNEGSRNKVAWETAGEAEISSYGVERSADGAVFSSIEEIPSKGTSGNYVSYDPHPKSGLTYYRLKIRATDGSQRYSQTVSAFLKSSGTIEMTVQPNPARDVLTVNLYGIQDGLVQVTDLIGRVVTTVAVSGSVAPVDVSGLAAGTYFIRYINGPVTKTSTVTKQ
ncbi:MAG: T9SS type A sorting domain-containing protein [Sphingobacteriales bacterium]|nr:MAG: T9SS type A sorting domain-containing protein [Sphingobacteriales bacterium]